MRLTVLGGGAAWPTAAAACSGYLLEHDGYRLLLDPGYATLPGLLHQIPAREVDAVLVSHGHPDHCADLHPLLRARVLGPEPAARLPVYAPAGALTAVLALDPPGGALDDAYVLRELSAGERCQIGPFQVETWLLPHFVPNLGLRLTAAGRVLAYTGDSGPSPDLLALAHRADLFLAEATFAEQVPDRFAGMLSTGRQAGGCAARAGVVRLLLTHVWPGSDAAAVVEAARAGYDGPVELARPGGVVEAV